MKCEICGHGKITIAYFGKVRAGAFPNLADGSKTVFECDSCGVQFLEHGQDHKYYQTGEYRESVGDSDLASHWRFISQILDKETISGLKLLDVGSGPGEFLDYCKPHVSKLYAVEPDETVDYGESVQRYVSVDQLLKDDPEPFNIITCFSVIEHVSDPLTLLASCEPLLSDQGIFIVSTPNRQDFNMAFLSDEFPRFFYRIAHKYYFHAESLANLGEQAGYDDIKICHYQRFGLDNQLIWARDKFPGRGEMVLPESEPTLDMAWRSYLEHYGMSDYLYMMMKSRGKEN